MDNIKNITILIAGRPYPLKIKENDEHVVRKIAKELNEMVNRFQLKYANKDKQDCLAMALLTYAVDLQKAKKEVTSQEVDDKLDSLDKFLEHLIN